MSVKKPKPAESAESEPTKEPSPESVTESSPDSSPEQAPEPLPTPEPEQAQEPDPEPIQEPESAPTPLIPEGVSLVDLLARKVLVDQNPALHPEVKKALADVAPQDLGVALSDPKLVQLNQALLAMQAQIDSKPAPITPPRAPVTPQTVPTVPAPPASNGAEAHTGRTLWELTPADFSEFAKLL